MDAEKLLEGLEQLEASLNYAKAYKLGGVEETKESQEFQEMLMAALRFVREHHKLPQKLGDLHESLAIEKISNRKARVALTKWDTLFPGSLEAIQATAGEQVAEAVKATRGALGK